MVCGLLGYWSCGKTPIAVGAVSVAALRIRSNIDCASPRFDMLKKCGNEVLYAIILSRGPSRSQEWVVATEDYRLENSRYWGTGLPSF